MKNTLRTVRLAGTTEGVLDGIAAIVAAWIRGVPPDRVFQYISSGLLGRASYEGGAGTIILGVVLHFIVAFGAATVFVLLARSIGFIRSNPLILGPLYGFSVYFFFSEVVVAFFQCHTSPVNTIRDRDPNPDSYILRRPSHRFDHFAFRAADEHLILVTCAVRYVVNT